MDQPPILDYGSAQSPQPVSPVRFRGLVTALLLADTVLGAAMVLSIFYIDRLRFAGVLMVLSGGLLLAAIFGCLSRERPRFLAALVMTFTAGVIATVCCALVAGMH